MLGFKSWRWLSGLGSMKHPSNESETIVFFRLACPNMSLSLCPWDGKFVVYSMGPPWYLRKGADWLSYLIRSENRRLSVDPGSDQISNFELDGLRMSRLIGCTCSRPCGQKYIPKGDDGEIRMFM